MSGAVAPAVQGACGGRARPAHGECILDIWPHPLTAEGRGGGLVTVPASATVADLTAAALRVDRSELLALAPAIEATLDGRRVAGEAWAATPLCVPGGEVSTLTLRLAVRGGDDSDPLETVLRIALVAAAVTLSAAIGGVWGALAAAALLVGGNLVLASVFEPDAPAQLEPGQAEPQYSLSGGGNRARPWAPLPLVLGRHRLFPDLAGREYTEFREGEQYLYQAFSFGVGDLDIGARSLGDTPLLDYDGVREELARPGTAITLVESAVATVSGGKMQYVEGPAPSVADWEAAWIARRTAPATTRIGVDLVSSLFGVGSDGSLREAADTIAIQWRSATAASDAAWSLRTVVLRHAERTPLRHTESITVASGQYDVRVRSSNFAVASDHRGAQDTTWTALRSYRAAEANRGGDTLLAVRVRASGQLTGRLERLSAIVSQKIPIWDGAAWTADTADGRRASSNPAAVFRAFARGWRDPSGRLLAGSGRPAADLDDAVLGRWYEWCRRRYWCTVDLVVDGRRSPEDIERLIARRGRAAPSWATGKYAVVWEAWDAAASASITPARALAGSVSVRWASGQVAEEIVARYIDSEDGWERREVRRLMPGVTAPAYTATVDLTGTVTRAQAVRECNLQAARQLYHRRRIVWAMGRDGATVRRGDVVFLSHDLVSGGATGRLAGGTAAAPRLDRAVAVAAGSHMLFEAPDGALHTSAVTGADGSDTATPALATALPSDPSARLEGAGPEDWTWRLYSAAAPPLRLRVVDVSPRAEDRFEITAIDEDARYHSAAYLGEDEALAAPPAWAGPRIVAAVVAERLLRVGAGWAVEIEVVVTVAGDWRGGAVLASLDGGTLQRVARIEAGDDSATWIAPPTGTLDIVIVPGSAVAPTGHAYRLRHEIGGALAPPGTPANFLIDVLPDGTRRFRWTAPPDIDLLGVEIRYAERGADGSNPPLWAAMRPLHRGFLTASPLETFEPPPGNWVFALRAVDTGGRVSPETRIVATLPDQRQGPTALWRCPSAEDWRPGSVVGVRSNDGANALEAAAAYTWADLATAGTTWAQWATWATGAGAGAAPHVSYMSDVIDLGAILPVTVAWSAASAGTVTVRWRHSTASAAAVADTPWEAVEPEATRARWVQFWITAAAGAGAVSRLDHLCWWLPAPVVERKLLDVSTATWSGTAGNRLIPREGLSLVTDVLVTLQGVVPGWSWSIDGKNPDTRLRIWNARGAPADANVDVILRGLS